MTNPQAIIKLRELVGENPVGMLATSAPDLELHARPLTLAEIDDDGRLWFVIDTTADWVEGVRFADAVNFSVADGSSATWVSVAGRAEVVNDPARIDRLWSRATEQFFGEGKDSDAVGLLSVTPASVEYWDAPSSAIKRMALMVRSAVFDDPSEMGDSGTLTV